MCYTKHKMNDDNLPQTPQEPSWIQGQTKTQFEEPEPEKIKPEPIMVQPKGKISFVTFVILTAIIIAVAIPVLGIGGMISMMSAMAGDSGPSTWAYIIILIVPIICFLLPGYLFFKLLLGVYHLYKPKPVPAVDGETIDTSKAVVGIKSAKSATNKSPSKKTIALVLGLIVLILGSILFWIIVPEFLMWYNYGRFQ